MPSEKPLPRKCGSLLVHWKKRYGQKMYCEANPLAGRTRCRKHGGATPRGIDSPHFRHGQRITRTFPDRLYQASYEQTLGDPRLTEYRRDIASMEVRLTELRDSLRSGGGAPVLVDNVIKCFGQLLKVSKAGKPTAGFLEKLRRAIYDLQQNSHTWSEIFDVIERKAKIVEKEQKRLTDTQQMMSLEQILVLTRHIVTILHEEIPDRTISRRINERIRGLLPELKREVVV